MAKHRFILVRLDLPETSEDQRVTKVLLSSRAEILGACHDNIGILLAVDENIDIASNWRQFVVYEEGAQYESPKNQRFLATVPITAQAWDPQTRAITPVCQVYLVFELF